MSAKNCDNHNRWRNITVGFRVRLPELFTVCSQEYEAIHTA